MEVLTPSGYIDASLLKVGDAVCAFDTVSGASIVNTIETVAPVDYAEWCRWWSREKSTPLFSWIRINGTFLMFREQSVWRNGVSVCHARDLAVGDIIHDDKDHDIVVNSVDEVEDNSLSWYRFDISGDHSYIADGVEVHNAARFWVGGTGVWDASTTTNWAAASGGAGGQTVPGSADAVTFDANSGAGNVTLNFGGTITIQSITCGAFTGTLDNSINNNNVTLNLGGGDPFYNFGTVGTRTINLGSATYSMTSTGTITWYSPSQAGLTLNAANATIAFAGPSSGSQTFNGAGETYGALSLGPCSGSGFYVVNPNGSGTINTLAIGTPSYVEFPFNHVTTVTNSFNFNGTSSAGIGLLSSNTGSVATIAAAAGSVGEWCALRDIVFSSGSPALSNSFDLGNNSGAIISAPTGAGGGVAGLRFPGTNGLPLN